MKTRSSALHWVAALTLGFLLLLAASNRPSRAQEGAHGPGTSPPLQGISFDRDLRTLPQARPAQQDRVLPLHRTPETKSPPTSGAPAHDRALQGKTTPRAMPSLLTSFKGLDFTNWGSGYPPDANGDVGPAHYVQAVQTSVGVATKSGVWLAAFSLDTFFADAGAPSPCAAHNQGDPVVLYDPLADRWLISDFAWINSPAGPFFECFAVSKSGDPVAGGWWVYAFPTGDVTHPWLADSPKLGVWPDGYYMTANYYDGSNTFQGVRVWALDRLGMQNGTLREVHFDLSNSYSDLLPSNLRGAAPPAGSPNYLMARDATTANQLFLWKFHVDYTTPSHSTLTGPAALAVTPWTVAGDVPQPGTTNLLDALSARLMMQLQYRRLGSSETLWAAHTVGNGGVAALRWYEILDPNGIPSVAQQGTFGPDDNHRWIPSLAVDHNGNMAMGYSLSSATVYPSIAYAGRLAADPAGTLGQGESILQDGTGSQTFTTRWGDYSSMTIDPVDDCTFWYTNEYYETSGGNWQTRIASFRYDGCGPQADLSVIKTASQDPAYRGMNLTYNLTMQNHGPDAAQSVSLSDSLPADTTFAGLSQTSGPAFSCSTPAIGAHGTVSCTTPSLGPSVSAAFSLVVRVSASASLTSTLSNTANVVAATSDPVPANNASTSSVGVTLAPPLFTVLLPVLYTGPSCYNVIVNDSFELDSTWEFPPTAYPAAYSTARAHSGLRSARTGIVNAADNRYSYSSVRQLFSIPPFATSATLHYWIYPTTTESPLAPIAPQLPVGSAWSEQPFSSDLQYVMVLDAANNLRQTLLWQRRSDTVWREQVSNLDAYIGTTLKLQFGTYNDGLDGITSMYVDDVNVTVCVPVGP